MRRNYLLLELLIALFLVTICLTPLLSPSFTMAKKTMEWITKRQLEPLAENAYAEVLQLMYENENIRNPKRIIWEQFRLGQPFMPVELEGPALLTFPKGKQIPYQRFYTIDTLREKEKESGDGFRKINITIFFKSPSGKTYDYAYPTLVVKGDIVP